jgi:hypothetical protein
MPLNVTYPSSVNVGRYINLGWSNTFNDDFFTVSKQINNNSEWLGTGFPINSNQTIHREQAEATWERVRYRIRGMPSGTTSTTGWITVVGGADPDPGGGDPGGPGDPDPDPLPPSTPTVLTPQSVTPGVSFQINWSDLNGTTAEYDIEESVNGGTYQRIASSWGSKSYSRTASSAWNVVKYRVRAIRNMQTSAWGYSADIIVEKIFPKMSVKVGAGVRTATDGWVKVNGTLRKITDIWVKVNGTLRKS